MVEQQRKQRVWFVTGSSSGFGRALSEAVLDHGDRLVATARQVDDIRALTNRGRELANAVHDRHRTDAMRSWSICHDERRGVRARDAFPGAWTFVEWPEQQSDGHILPSAQIA